MKHPPVPESGSLGTGGRWWLWVTLLLAGTVAAAGWTVHRDYERQRELAAQRLSALAELRDTQIAGWIQRQLALAAFLSSSPVFAEQFLRWQQQGDQEAGERLLARVVQFRQANDADSMLIVGADGLPLAREHPAASATPDPSLTATVLRALASGRPEHTGVIFRAGGSFPLRLDVVVPLLQTGTPPVGALVLRLDAERTLLPLLAAGPLSGHTTRVSLWRRQDKLLLPQDGAAVRAASGAGVSWLQSPLLPARVLRGEVPADDVVAALDAQGEPVLATARAVTGTDWWLLVQVSLDEVEAPAHAAALRAAAVVLLLLAMGALSLRVWGQRQSLALARRERHEHRERLRALGLLQAVTQSSGDAIYAKDTEGRYVLYNRAACAELGLAEHEVLGRSDEEVFGPEVAARLRANDRQVLEADEVRQFEEPMPTPQGVRETLATKGPLRDAEGRLLGVFGVSRDVSQARRAERALRDSEAHLRSVIDVLAEGVLVLDPQGRVLSCNPAAERIVGSLQQDWQGRNVIAPGWEVLDAAGHALAPEDTPPGRVLATGHGEMGALLQARNPQGEVRWFELSALPVTSPGDGRLLAVVCSFWDVTDRKAHEDELARHRQELEHRVQARTAELRQANDALAEARDRAEAASRAKSAFLANMSHEIRTPMNAIIGLAHLMARDTRDAAQQERLRKLDRAAQHLLQVINDILDLSKIEAGKFTLEDSEFSLDAMVTRCFEMVSERAHEKGLELVLDTDHLPARMRGDPTRLSQALINLLSNAVKFTDRGWVRLQGELLSEDGQDLHVRFQVQDTGPGIAREHQEALFRAFEQADGSITRRHGGTGLGLALTRHLARMMRGDAGLRSQPGMGSTFWFTATLRRAAEPAADTPPVSLRGLRALLVDDLPEARTALLDRLRLLGLQAEALADGPAAVRRAADEAAAGRAYDVMLVDWRMKPLDGFQTLRQLRELLGAGMPPSILVTAFDDPGMWSQARSAGCDAVLVKPITASALHDTLVAVLRQQHAPLAEPVARGAAEARLFASHRGRRILLAEDNPINQEVAGALLGAVGLVVETADNGTAAVDMALSRPYDLVLMDVQMPGMDGLAATRALRERAGPALPIIAMTAHVFGEDRAACEAAGMNDHVAKPVDPEVLYTTLLRWLPQPAARTAAPPLHAPVTAPAGGLGAVPGFDLGVALRNMGGQAPVMQRVLERFITTYASGEPALADTGSADDLRRWRHAAHSLRGACATVGATGLEGALREFEAALAAQAPDVAALAAQAAALHEALQSLVSDLGDALRTATPLQ